MPIKGKTKPSVRKKIFKKPKVSTKTELTLKEKAPAGQKQAEPEKKIRKQTGRKPTFERIRKKLLRQKKAILTEAGVAMNSLPEQSTFPDLGDQASVECDRNFMLKLRSREQRLLKKIEDAMERIGVGIFGICEVCGNPIEMKRLEARPVTTMCIDCKTEQEEEEKLRGT